MLWKSEARSWTLAPLLPKINDNIDKMMLFTLFNYEKSFIWLSILHCESIVLLIDLVLNSLMSISTIKQLTPSKLKKLSNHVFQGQIKLEHENQLAN